MRTPRFPSSLLVLSMALSLAVVALAANAAFDRLRPGGTGWKVRVLQSRLHQLGLHCEVITSRFDAQTRDGIRRLFDQVQLGDKVIVYRS